MEARELTIKSLIQAALRESSTRGRCGKSKTRSIAAVLRRCKIINATLRLSQTTSAPWTLGQRYHSGKTLLSVHISKPKEKALPSEF